ncbi:MAG: type II secretion system F family protein [Marmoricola sp.]
MVLYVGALTVALGLAVACGMVLVGRSDQTGVARSLALIEKGARNRQEHAHNEAELGDRLVDGVLRLGRKVAGKVSPAGTTERLARQLDFAGNPSGWTVERLLAVKGVALLGGGLLGLLIGHLSALGLLLAVAFAAGGFWMPGILVYNIGLHRQEELRLGLADALDMLTVCVEAGQGFDAALQQVARSVTGPVAGEFARVLQEISIGKSRADAFTAMGSRTSVPEIKTFVTALSQADRFGLPIGNVIREQADQMRLVRKQRAEEKAQKVPVKIMIPLIFCIFPLIFVVILGPGVMQMMAMFSGMHL